MIPPQQVRELCPRVRRAMIRAKKKAEQQKLGATYTRKSKKKEEDKEKEVGA